ncbi:uncharacterized protein [Watersipora subatra]|uniref:uncharacterized protein n=1 Tax=Watersipora subatra TaxID=2589382 RepID=UPI00355AF7D3
MAPRTDRIATLLMLIGCCSAFYETTTSRYLTVSDQGYDYDDYELTLHDLRSELRDAVHEMVVGGRPNNCPKGMIYCVKARKCIPAVCDMARQTTVDLPYKITPTILSKAVDHTLDLKHLPYDDLCPTNMTFCLENNQCVKTYCNSVKDGDGSMIRDNLKDTLQQTIEKLITKKTASQDFCPRGMVFCLYSFQCVRIDCKEDENYGNYDNYGPTLEDISRELEHKVNSFFGSQTDENVCGEGLVYCTSWDACVSPSCSRTIDNYGECPDLADVGICSIEQECLSDSEGCEGNDKCCPNSCGGSSCVSPEIILPDPGEEGYEKEPYKVTAYLASLDPEPIRMTGGQGIFGNDAPNRLKFYVSTASAGCSWKKVESEEMIQDADGGSEVIRKWTAITEGEVLDIGTPIASMPSDISFHGLTKVIVNDVEGNKNYTLAVIILPANLPPNISLLANYSTNIVLREDELVVNFTLPVNISSPMSLTRVKMSTEDMIGVQMSDKGNEIYEGYKKRMEDLRKNVAGSLGVHVKLRNVQKEFGTISLLSNSSTLDKKDTAISLKSGGYGLPIINYEPKKDFTGTFSLALFAWSGSLPAKAKDLSKENVTFNIEIINVNDAPKLPESGLDDLQFSPRKMWTQLLVPLDLDTNEGILISEIVSKFFTDPDGGKLGLCFLRAADSDLGVYQYKPEGSDTWFALSVADPSANFAEGVMTTFSPKQIARAYNLNKFEEVLSALQEGTLPAYEGDFAHECQAVKDSSRLRFKLKNADSFWPYNSDTKWDAMAWDQSVEGEEGEMMPVSLPLCLNCTRDSSALSYVYISGDAMRLGCNDKASPVPLVFDICNDCGGDGSKCVDCNGDQDGDAIMNQCGNCVLGNTGINDPDHGRDCKGGCTSGVFEVFDQLDGACLPADIDADAIIQEVYCDGVWRSGAKIDSCGNCTGGTSGRERDFAKDACDVCHGDSSSCLDCENVPNGLKETDMCGSCLFTDDASFNKGCAAVVGSFEPEYAVPNVGGFITIYGADLLDTVDIDCSLESDQVTVPLQIDEANLRRSILYTSYEAIDNVGTYSVKCVIDGSESTVTSAMFNVILPEVTSLSPSTIEIGNIPGEVVMTGTGFVSTGDEVCFTNCPARISKDCRTADSVAVVEAKVIDSTTVHCIIPTSLRKQLDFGITLDVSFAINDPRFVFPEERAVYTTQQLVFTAPAPQILSATFLGACKIVVVFDVTISEVESCEDAFNDASVAKLGADPECFVRGSGLMIVLGTDSTLAASDSLSLKEEAIRQRNADGDVYASGSVTVDTSNIESVKFEYFQAPQVIGNCDSLDLRAKFQGAPCSDLTYTWTVELVGDSGNADVDADLAEVATTLSSISTGIVSLTSDDIFPGSTYQFSVYTTNHLGEVSETKTKIVERKATAQELTIDLGADKLDFDPSKDLRLRAKVGKSECAEFEMTGVQFMWNSATADFSLEDFTSVSAKVPSRSLRGGKTYEITLMAIVTNDPSITAEASLTVTTLSRDLIPKIRRSPIMHVGVGQEISLDASESLDPDKAEGEITYYVWTCEKIILNDALEESYQPCEIPDPGQDGTYVQFEDSSITEDELLDVITIPPYTLDTLSLYRFTLHMSKGERSASESILVQVKEGQPPSVTIEPIEGQHQYGEDLYIVARISSPLAFTASWSSSNVPGLEQLDYDAIGEDSSYSIDSGKSNYPVNLRLDAAYLKGGATYRLVLTVAHQDSDAEAQIDVTVNAPPTCASLQVSPEQGIALTDEFVLEVSGCEDEPDDFPLFFKFISISGDTERDLTSSQLDSIATQVLPQGSFSFRVIVCDQQGACSSLSSEGVVSVSDVELNDDFLNSITTQIEEQQTLSGSSSMASAAIGYLVEGDVSDEFKQIGMDIAKNEAKNTLSKANAQADPEGCADNLNSARDTLLLTQDVTINGVKQPVVDSSTSQQLMNKSTEVIQASVDGTETDGNSRKKRATEEASSINPIDIEMVN